MEILAKNVLKGIVCQLLLQMNSNIALSTTAEHVSTDSTICDAIHDAEKQKPLHRTIHTSNLMETRTYNIA